MEHLVASVVDSGGRVDFTSAPQPFPLDAPHHRLDNGDLTATEAASRIVRRLRIPLS